MVKNDRLAGEISACALTDFRLRIEQHDRGVFFG
jgi:hypothetical protein